METKSFDLKKEYQKFTSGLKEYHKTSAEFNDPEQMVFQFKTRSSILGNISELCNTFNRESHHILYAFDKYKKYMQKSGVNIEFDFFSYFTTCLIHIISEREEICKWTDQLLDEVEYLEENKVSEMTVEDINKI